MRLFILPDYKNTYFLQPVPQHTKNKGESKGAIKDWRNCHPYHITGQKESIKQVYVHLGIRVPVEALQEGKEDGTSWNKNIT